MVWLWYKGHKKTNMIRNYLITAFRNFSRSKSYTLLNILGLSVGVTACILIFLIISNELNYDKFHANYQQLYRVVRESSNASGIENTAVTPYPFAATFRNDFEEVPVTQMHYDQFALLSVGSDKRLVDDVLFADSLFFDVFSFEVVSGNPKVALGQPGSLFLTESLAEKLGVIDPQQKIMLGNEIELSLAGIVKDPPAESHIQFSLIVSMPSFNSEYLGLPIDEWGMSIAGFNYVVLPENSNVADIDERLKNLVDKHYKPDDAKVIRYMLQPIADIHFSKLYEDNPGTGTTVEYGSLVILAIIGIFILLIACVNFVNLATALAIKKSKEIGIRKTLGAQRHQLVSYFLGETFILILFTLFISLCLVEWVLPWLNTFLDKSLELALLSNPQLIIFLIVLLVLTTFFSGFYPALVLSGFSPNEVLKNKISGRNSSGAFLRKALVVFQFFIAQALIIGTIVVSQQMNFFKSKPLGFDKDLIIDVQMPDTDATLRESFKNRLQANSQISNVSFSVGSPSSENNISTSYFLTERGRDEEFDVSLKVADRNYRDTYGLKLVAGEWFSESQENQTLDAIPEEERSYVLVINETAARQMGFSNPEDILGKELTIGLNRISAPVIGVVSDFHIASLHKPIAPVVMINFPYFYYNAGIRLQPDQVNETLAFIEKNWQEVYPDYFYRSSFLDDDIAEFYAEEDRIFKLFSIFAGISIFIGCLGLYGLVSFMTTQRMKEVGVRKVLGASVSNITMLFSKDFLLLVFIAFALAAPLTWLAMNQWLQTFAYKISIGWNVFAIGIIITLVLTFITVSYRSIKAAMVNPASIIRNE